MIAKIFRFIIVASFYTLASLWCYTYSHYIKHPGESDALQLLIFTFPVSIFVLAAFILVLDRDVPRPSWHPDHPKFAVSAVALLLLAFFFTTPARNPWSQYGARVHRIQGGSSSSSIYLMLAVDHRGETITDFIPGGVRSDWRYDCRDLNADGIPEIIAEDAEGRSVTTFIPARGDRPPAFKMLEWTWKD